MSSRRSRLLLAVVVLLAAACSRVPPGGEAVGVAALGPRSSDGELAAAADTNGDFPGASAGSRATRSGPSSRSVSGPLGAAGPLVTEGIDYEKRTVKLVYATKLESCGPDSQSSSANVANDKGRRVLQTYVDFFNKEVLAPHRWKLTYELVDDGGAYCPEKGRAAARAIIQERKPFAVIGGAPTISQGPVLADAVTRAGIVHIGASWATFNEIRKRHPYEWETGVVPEAAYNHLVEFMGKRLKNTKYRDPSSGLESNRVYGMVAIDLPEVRTLASIVKRRLAEVGIDLAQTYFVSADPGVASQSAPTTVSKMRSDGVNTLIFDMQSGANGGYAQVVYTSAMNTQNYLPQIVVGVYGIPFWESLFDDRVWNPVGTSVAGIIALRNGVRTNAETGKVEEDPQYEEIAENVSGYQKVWERAGNNDHAQDGSLPQAYAIWTEFTLLAQGIMHAGPTLDVQSWARGVDTSQVGGPNRCGVERFTGRDYPYNPRYDWDGSHNGGAEGYTTIHWVDKQTPLGTRGYYESYDNYRYFSGDGDLPAAATWDTDTKGYDVRKQERIGLRPWTPCAHFGLKD